MKHHRIVAARAGGPDVLQWIEEDVPTPKPGEVLVRVLTAGVSAYDIMIRQSRLMPPKAPFTPGVDVVGVVEQLGENVDGFKLGQRVAALLGFGNGGYAEMLCVPAKDLVLVPDHLDPGEAVCLVANYLTAHRVMYADAKIQPGEKVLIQGAAGGVGSAILELGRLAELEMYGTASKQNHELVESLGATPIDYKSENVAQRVRMLSGGGVDAAFDHIGGFRQLRGSYRALGKNGRLVWYGVAATKHHGIRIVPYSILTMLLFKLLPDGRQSILSGDQPDYPQRILPGLLAQLSDGKLKPLIAERMPLADARCAHELVEKGGYQGKFVLVSDAYGGQRA